MTTPAYDTDEDTTDDAPWEVAATAAKHALDAEVAARAAFYLVLNTDRAANDKEVRAAKVAAREAANTARNAADRAQKACALARAALADDSSLPVDLAANAEDSADDAFEYAARADDWAHAARTVYFDGLRCRQNRSERERSRTCCTAAGH